jgi:outer membrane protein
VSAAKEIDMRTGSRVWGWTVSIAFLAVTIAMSSPQVAAAQGYGKGKSGGSNFHWSAALGVGMRPDYEGSDHYKPFPVGGAKIWWDDGRYSELSGTESSGSAVRLSGNLIPNSPIELGPVLQYRLERDDVKSGRIDAMNSIDGAIETGVLAAYRIKPWVLELSYVYDISNEHGGSLIEMAGGYDEKLSPNLDMGVTVASTWASGAYMGTYFNVSPTESARTGLSAYDADDGFKDVGVRVRLGWKGDDWGGWKLLGSFAYFRLLGDAEDSPVVDTAGSEDQFFGGVAIGYER